MTRDEGATVLVLMDGTPQLVAQLLYGSGLRIMEAVRLRVQDIDFAMKPLTVRSGKGDKDRFTTFPATLTPLLQNQPARVNMLHQQDVAQGQGADYLPHALARKSLHTATIWGWQYAFPPGTSPSTHVPVSPVDIMLTPTSSTKPSRWPGNSKPPGRSRCLTFLLGLPNGRHELRGLPRRLQAVVRRPLTLV